MSDSIDFNSPTALFSQILTKVDTLTRTTEESHREIKECIESHAQRLVELERSKWYERGAAAAISAAVVMFWNIWTAHPDAVQAAATQAHK